MEHPIIFLRAFIVLGYEKTKGFKIWVFLLLKLVDLRHTPSIENRQQHQSSSSSSSLQIFKASKRWTTVELKECSPEVVDELIDAW
ncbi:hypothetical protein Tco_0180077 [Tanacetum coccineum]